MLPLSVCFRLQMLPSTFSITKFETSTNQKSRLRLNRKSQLGRHSALVNLSIASHWHADYSSEILASLIYQQTYFETSFNLHSNLPQPSKITGFCLPFLTMGCLRKIFSWRRRREYDIKFQRIREEVMRNCSNSTSRK